MSLSDRVKSIAGLVTLSGLYAWIIILVLAHMSAPVWGPVWASLAPGKDVREPETKSGPAPEVPGDGEPCLIIEGVKVCDPNPNGDIK